MGRPTTRERTAFGQRLFERREAVGLTQAEVAERLGISQRAYSAWERDPVAILPERLVSIAEILGTTPGDLLVGEPPPRNGHGPGGRLGQTFERVGQLPRRQQGKILDVVEALLAQQMAEVDSS